MQTNVTVNKSDLLAILQVNRDAHRATFEKALVEFRRQAVARLDAMIEEVKGARPPKRLVVGLPIPEEHTNDYDRSIGMLRMHTGDTIELSSGDYRMLVDDDWGWRQEFLSNTSSYINRD